MSWLPVSKDMTGYAPMVIIQLAATWNVEPRYVFASLVLVHMNPTHKQLLLITAKYIYDPEEAVPCLTGFMKKLDEVFSKSLEKVLCDNDRRFRYRDPLFRAVTAIGDGVPVFACGPRSCFNGKHGQKYYSLH
eukprot:PhM_4_TR3000/c2_g4_i1/m.37741